MELDPGEISLMSAGACGAFVHGLEDEFMGKCINHFGYHIKEIQILKGDCYAERAREKTTIIIIMTLLYFFLPRGAQCHGGVDVSTVCQQPLLRDAEP